MSDSELRPVNGQNIPINDQVMAAIIDVRRIATSNPSSLEGLDQVVAVARRSMTLLDTSGFMQRPDNLNDRVFIITTLQNLAYYNFDGEAVPDIARWCMDRWLELIQRDGESTAALRGLGQAWLARSQNLLSRIHRQEGSASSGSSGRPHSLNDRLSYTSTEDVRDAERAASEADARAHTADYVEARGTLIPAVDYFSRAVEMGERRGEADGDLLSEAAEANMSLGNVSYSHINEQYFHRAIRYLRRASQIPNYRLSPYLQGYLDDYGRLVD